MNPNEETVRKMIRHENDMINHRLVWLVQIQGFLFTAFAIAWEKIDTWLATAFFSLLGSIVALVSMIALYCSHKAIDRLHTWWTVRNSVDQSPDVVGYWSKNPVIRLLGPWASLPVVFILAWIAVFFLRVSQFAP